MTEKYSDAVCRWMAEAGYTHCFFVAGGNIMHFLESASRYFTCIPVVHEVSAGIASEYFNATSPDGRRAFALVTAGPGLTNATTAIAGAYLESRELLVIGGQVKRADLKPPGLRQRGVQEIDGISIVKSITKAARRIQEPISRREFEELVSCSWKGRRGPVFLEFCLDAQAAPFSDVDPRSDVLSASVEYGGHPAIPDEALAAVERLLEHCERPILLLGGGVSRESAAHLRPLLEEMGIPIATSWNAADRIEYSHPLFFGRPDTWGMRWANVLLQQSDMVIAVGARLGLQQTGFNWESFAPLAEVVHVDIDDFELAKSHPRKSLTIKCDSQDFLWQLGQDIGSTAHRFESWVAFGQEVKKALPVNEAVNETSEGHISPYALSLALSRELNSEDIIVPCSSGGASTVMMQSFQQKLGQVLINDKALASMGYGLAGSIGASVANPDKRVVLTEGDGGFAQNLQELGTVAQQQLPIKMFILCNEGYASIRMTQKNYFGGHYVGCDRATGLGLPEWKQLFAAYSIECETVPTDPSLWSEVSARLSEPGPAAFLVPVDPEQTFYPKISSRVAEDGSMQSAALHEMSPPLAPDIQARVMQFLQEDK